LRGHSGIELVKKNERSVLRLTLACEQVDLWRFRDKVVQAKGMPAHRKVHLLHEAVELWAGPALVGLDPRWVGPEMARLRAEGRAAFLELARLCAEQEDLDQAIEHTARADLLFPDDHEIWSGLWRLLSRDGRSQAIIDDLHRREDVAGGAGSLPAAVRAEAKSLVAEARLKSKTQHVGLPYQLPPAAANLHGRDADLAVLDRLTDPASGVRAITICGLGGLGKTALAVNWAHAATGHFLDAVLFADLRGFSAVGSAESADVLRKQTAITVSEYGEG